MRFKINGFVGVKRYAINIDIVDIKAYPYRGSFNKEPHWINVIVIKPMIGITKNILIWAFFRQRRMMNIINVTANKDRPVMPKYVLNRSRMKIL
jgi:hypothetical protein